MVSVDGELDQALAFVDGLSTSPNFVKGDFAALQVQAREALAPYGYVLILKSADGQQEYVNTRRQPRSVGGVPVSGRLRPGSAESAYLRRIEDRWLAMVDVPIEDQGGQRVYTMSAFGGKADIGSACPNVCFVPIADILRCGEIRRYSITSSATWWRRIA